MKNKTDDTKLLKERIKALENRLKEIDMEIELAQRKIANNLINGATDEDKTFKQKSKWQSIDSTFNSNNKL